MSLLFAVWGLRVLRAGFDCAVLTAEQLSINASVLVFTLAVSVASAFLFGLAPLLHLSHRDANKTC